MTLSEFLACPKEPCQYTCRGCLSPGFGDKIECFGACSLGRNGFINAFGNLQVTWPNCPWSFICLLPRGKGPQNNKFLSYFHTHTRTRARARARTSTNTRTHLMHGFLCGMILDTFGHGPATSQTNIAATSKTKACKKLTDKCEIRSRASFGMKCAQAGT